MERYGTFKQEPFECAAYIGRNRQGEYFWLIKVKEDGVPGVREFTEPMISSYEDKDEEGNTTAMNVDPKDLANVQILQDRTEKILAELAEARGEVSPTRSEGDTLPERVPSGDPDGGGSDAGRPEGPRDPGQGRVRRLH